MKISGILGFLGFTACSNQQPLPPGPYGTNPHQEIARRVEKNPDLAVLFIGNSYSFGVPKAFSKVAAGHGKKVKTAHSTYSGWTLARHAANEATLAKIRNGRWDIVVIQEHSEIPALPTGKRDAKMLPPLRLLVTEVRKQGAIPVLYQTWGRRDGDKNVRHDDFYKMTRRLREGYQAAGRNAGCLAVIPVGDAWEKEFSAGNGTALFMPDGSHPSALGNEITARVFYEAFFGK
jgi:hypothetical protein